MRARTVVVVLPIEFRDLEVFCVIWWRLWFGRNQILHATNALNSSKVLIIAPCCCRHLLIAPRRRFLLLVWERLVMYLYELSLSKLHC
ncbi:hypothetical protein ACOSQ4_022838 [Xanthoceras sorbifolium]